MPDRTFMPRSCKERDVLGGVRVIPTPYGESVIFVSYFFNAISVFYNDWK